MKKKFYYTGLIVSITQELEKILPIRYNAYGTGLNSLLTSVERWRIPDDVRKKIRTIAYIRNQVAHSDVSLAVKGINEVISSYREVCRKLNIQSDVPLDLKPPKDDKEKPRQRDKERTPSTLTLTITALISGVVGGIVSTFVTMNLLPLIGR